MNAFLTDACLIIRYENTKIAGSL